MGFAGFRHDRNRRRAIPRDTILGFSTVGGLGIDTILLADGENITKGERFAGT